VKISGPDISGSFGLNGIPFTRDAPEEMDSPIYLNNLEDEITPTN